LASIIRAEVAQMILRDLNDPRLTGLPTVTRVKVTDDLAAADVFVTIMGTPGQQTAALNALKHAAGLMRTRLNESLSLRVPPFLRFHFDEELKKEIAMQELLLKVARENAELDRRRAQAAAKDSPGQPTDAPGQPPADLPTPDPQS